MTSPQRRSTRKSTRRSTRRDRGHLVSGNAGPMVATCSAVRLGSMGQHRSLMIDYNTCCKSVKKINFWSTDRTAMRLLGHKQFTNELFHPGREL